MKAYSQFSITFLLATFIGSVTVVNHANGALATFDSLTEGSQGFLLVDGGITFFDPLFTTGSITPFVAEQADGTLSGPFFSPNNVLGQGGFVPGASGGFPVIGSFKMTTGGVEDFISVEMFTFVTANTSGATVHLDLMLGGSLVGGTSLVLGGAGIQHHTLSISGTSFDEAKIFGTGSFQNGAFTAVFDNIRIGNIPEPATATMLAAALLGLAAYRLPRKKAS